MKGIKKLALSMATIMLSLFAIPVASVVAAGTGQIEGGSIYLVRNLTQNGAYATSASATACDELVYSIRLHNSGFTALNNINVKASLPGAVSTNVVSTMTATYTDGVVPSTSASNTVNINPAQNVSYLNGSAKLYDAAGTVLNVLPDGITAAGVNIGSINGSTTKFLNFRAKVNCPQPPVDVCPNIDGVQTTVPAGLVKDSNGNCVEKPKVDVCPNIDGVQITVPEGFEKDSNGNCVKKVVISTAECKATDVKIGTGRNVTVAINTTVNNATIVGYKIDFGDGTTANTQTANHTYAKDGTYKIVGSVEVKFADGTTRSVNADNCVKNVTFKADEPPVVVPTPVTPVTPIALPNTGAGSIAAIFGAVTTIATLAFSVVSRRFGRQL